MQRVVLVEHSWNSSNLNLSFSKFVILEVEIATLVPCFSANKHQRRRPREWTFDLFIFFFDEGRRPLLLGSFPEGSDLSQFIRFVEQACGRVFFTTFSSREEQYEICKE